MTSGDNATSSAAAVEGLGIRPTCFDPDVPAIGPSEFMECCSECCDMGVPLRIAPGESHQHTYAPHPLALLRARRERPCCRPATEQRDEFASSQGWHGLSPPRAAVFRTLSLARRDRSVLGTTLNRSRPPRD